MAKIRSGILGKASGKVAGIVAATYRGINYVREAVIPANPQSAAQTQQRTKFGRIVKIGSQILTGVINSFWDRLQVGKTLTGFNRFVQHNLNLMSTVFDPTKLVFSVGSLDILASFSGNYNNVSGVLTAEWVSTTPTSGSPTDDVIVAAYSEENEFIYFGTGTKIRSDPNDTISMPTGLDFTKIRLIGFADNGTITSLSQNVTLEE